jgi:hypothetical protein
VTVALHATTLFEAEADCGHRGHDSEATARLAGRWDTHRTHTCPFEALGTNKWHYAPYGPHTGPDQIGSPLSAFLQRRKGLIERSEPRVSTGTPDTQRVTRCCCPELLH